MRNNKKGQLQLINTGVIVLTIGAVLLILGLIMLDDLYIQTATTSATVLKETETTVTNASETVTLASACGFHDFSIINVTNATVGVVIAASNYTVTDTRLGTWKLTDAGAAGAFNNLNMNVSYSYVWGGTSTVCNDANDTIAGMGKLGDYFDLIVLAIVISVIIGLILIGFALKRTR